jgi:hypothetical protein
MTLPDNFVWAWHKSSWRPALNLGEIARGRHAGKLEVEVSVWSTARKTFVGRKIRLDQGMVRGKTAFNQDVTKSENPTPRPKARGRKRKT